MSNAGWILTFVVAGGASAVGALIAYLVRDFRRWWDLSHEL